MSRDDFLVPCKYGPPMDLGPRRCGKSKGDRIEEIRAGLAGNTIYYPDSAAHWQTAARYLLRLLDRERDLAQRLADGLSFHAGESIAACPACGPGTAAIQAHADHRDAIAALFLETGRLLGAFQIRWERGENLSLDAVAALVQVRTLLRRAAEGVR